MKKGHKVVSTTINETESYATYNDENGNAYHVNMSIEKVWAIDESMEEKVSHVYCDTTVYFD